MANKAKTSNTTKSRYSKAEETMENRKNKHTGSSRSRRSAETSRVSSGHTYRDVHSGTNDPSWWNLIPSLVTDSASIPFSNPVGTPFDMGAQQPDGTDALYTVPGITRLGFVPTYGKSTDYTSAINVAAAAIYSWVRHQNSGSRNYERADILMYALAIDGCVMTYGQLLRAYGLLNKYSQTNRYLCEALITAMGFNFADMLRHMPQYRELINTIAFKLGRFAIPKNFTVFERHFWMTQFVGIDSPSTKGHIYFWSPDGIPVFAPKTSSTGGEMYLAQMPAPIYTKLNGAECDMVTWDYAEWFAFANKQLDQLLLDEDIGIISGDIIKAYGESALLKLSEIPVTGYNTEITSSDEVNEQIMNAFFAGPVSEDYLIDFLGTEPFFGKAPYIAQSPDTQMITTNLTVQSPEVAWTIAEEARAALGRFAPLINTFRMQPTPMDVMIMTRDAVRVGHYTNTEAQLLCYASEVPTKATTYTITEPMSSRLVPTLKAQDWQSLFFLDDKGNGPLETNVMRDAINLLINLAAFDWHPTVYPIFVEFDTEGYPSLHYLNPCCDIDNATVIDPNQLARIHDVAVLSLFGAPSMGWISR